MPIDLTDIELTQILIILENELAKKESLDSINGSYEPLVIKNIMFKIRSIIRKK